MSAHSLEVFTSLEAVRKESSMLKEEIFQAADLCVVGNVNRDMRLAPLAAGDHLFEDGETTVGMGLGNRGRRRRKQRLRGGGTWGTRGTPRQDRGRQPRRAAGETLVRHGVHAHLTKSAACATGTSVAVSFTTGHRHFISSLPNNESLAFEDLPLATLDRIHPPVSRRCLVLCPHAAGRQ